MMLLAIITVVICLYVPELFPAFLVLSLLGITLVVLHE